VPGGGGARDSACPALWWPGLGNGFLGTIAQSPSLRIAGYFSGNYSRYSAGAHVPPVASHGFSNKLPAYRARIPAYASSLGVRGAGLPGRTRFALDVRRAVYIGLGHIVALLCSSSTFYQIHERSRCLYF
jgi:hypothetical protein